MGQWRQARAPRRRLAVDDVMSRIPGGETLREAAADYGSRISEVTALPELATERHFGDSNLVRRISRVNIQASGPGVAVGNLWLRFSGGGVLPWWLSVVFGMIAGCDRRAAGAARGSS